MRMTMRRKEGEEEGRKEMRGAANSKRGPNTQEGWELNENLCLLSLGALLEGLLEPSWKPPGASWGILDGLGRLLARLTPSEAVLGASLGRLGAFLERFSAILGPSWEPLGRSWGRLGPTWGALGGLLGCLGAILEAS